MAIRLRTKKLIYSGLAGAGVMLLIASTGGYVFYQNAQEHEIELKNEYQSKVKELEKTALQNEAAYSLAVDVKKGELITSDMLQQVYVPSAASSTDKFLIGLLNGTDARNFYAKTDLKANTLLTDSMVYKDEPITEDIREAEYSFIELPSKLEKKDFVDIRIQFPSGDDYIVFSKKKVTDILGLTVWLNVDEGEILTMSSAIVDAYVEGAKIYAIPYVDEHMQSASQMTYPVKQNVKELIQESPNIINIAKLNLEKQNRARMENYLRQVQEEDRSKINTGEATTDSKVQQDVEKRSTEERINALNKQQSQEALIGGDGKGGNE